VCVCVCVCVCVYAAVLVGKKISTNRPCGECVLMGNTCGEVVDFFDFFTFIHVSKHFKHVKFSPQVSTCIGKF